MISFYSYSIFPDCSFCRTFFYIRYKLDTKVTYEGYVSIPPYSPDYTKQLFYPNADPDSATDILAQIKTIRNVELCSKVKMKNFDPLSSPSSASYICYGEYKIIPGKKFRYAIKLNNHNYMASEMSFVDKHGHRLFERKFGKVIRK